MYPSLQLRLDHRVTCSERGDDSVSAVPHDEEVAVPCETHRRSDTALLEPLAVPRHLRHVDAARPSVAESNVVEASPDRLRVRAHARLLSSRRESGVRTDGVEPPQPGAAALQAVELADAQRPHRSMRGVADRTRTGTARFTTSGARRYTTATMERGRRDSNPRLFARQATALAAELRPPSEAVARVGFEPTVSSS